MFGWLKRLFGSKQLAQPNKEIFRYWDGIRWRWGDPFALQRDLETHGGKGWMELLRVADNPTGGVPLEKLSPGMLTTIAAQLNQSVHQLAELARKAFDLPPFDTRAEKTGLTESGCVSLVCDFLQWVSECREEFLPLLLPSMPGPLASTDATTEPSAASSSINPDSDTKERSMSPTESESLSVAST